jgi:hypothetical protein
MGSEGDKPTIEKINIKRLFSLKFCNPVEDKLKEIEVCLPHIEIVACNPASEVKNMRDLMCVPFVSGCVPQCSMLLDICMPRMMCAVCVPQGYDVKDIKTSLDEVKTRLAKIEEEIEEFRKSRD